MPFLKWVFTCLALACGPSNADELLPVAVQHKSMAFVLDNTKVRLPTGAGVEFFMKDEGGVPRKIEHIRGFVLGTHDGVLFIELSDQKAIRLARHRATGTVTVQKASDPVADEVQGRRDMLQSGANLYLAPRMQQLTVEMELDRQTVSAWSPGDMLTFYNARETPRYARVNGQWEQTGVNYLDANAIFHSAVETQDGQFEITVVASSFYAEDIVRADLDRRLSIEDLPAPKVQKPAADPNCYVTTRRGTERRSSRVTCPD